MAVFLSSDIYAEDGITRNILIGSWEWSEHVGDNYYIFNFQKSGTLETVLQEPNGRGPGIGEGLGDEGRYHLQHGKLIITRAHVQADGWPSRNNNPPFTYVCGLKIAPDGNTIGLSGCSISGKWVRQHP